MLVIFLFCDIFFRIQDYPATSKWNHSTYSHAKYRDGTMVRRRNSDACLFNKIMFTVLSLDYLIVLQGNATFQSNGLCLGCQWS